MEVVYLTNMQEKAMGPGLMSSILGSDVVGLTLSILDYTYYNVVKH